jgi:hypothetical protein
LRGLFASGWVLERSAFSERVVFHGAGGIRLGEVEEPKIYRAERCNDPAYLQLDLRC